MQNLSAPEALALIQRFIDRLPGTVYLKDANLRLLLVNQFLADILGADKASLIGKTNHEIFPPAFADTITEWDRQMLASGGSRTVAEEFADRHWETHMFVMQDGQGRKLLGGLSVDVTEHHHHALLTRNLLALQELGADLPERDLLAHGLAMTQTLTHSPSSLLRWADDAQVGLELDGQTGQAPTPAARSVLAALWRRCSTQPQPVVCNDAAACLAQTDGARHEADGGQGFSRLLAAPVSDQGRLRLLLVAADKQTAYTERDTNALQLLANDLWRIAQRNRTEARLRERVQELAEVNRQLSQAHLQLLQPEKMASIGQLAAGVAHELNSPIGFVKSNLGTLEGYLRALLATVDAYTQAEAVLQRTAPEVLARIDATRQNADLDFMRQELPQLLQETRHGVERIGQTVRNLRDFAGPEHQGWEATDLHAALESALSMAQHSLGPRVKLIRAYGAVPDVLCQPGAIRQVMLALLLNASQAITPPGTITLRTGSTDSMAWLEVQDSGCGMTPEQLAHAFEPFYSTKATGRNPGLGLATAWQVVQQHQGRLHLQSLPHQGTTARLELPLMRPDLNPSYV